MAVVIIDDHSVEAKTSTDKGEKVPTSNTDSDSDKEPSPPQEPGLLPVQKKEKKKKRRRRKRKNKKIKTVVVIKGPRSKLGSLRKFRLKLPKEVIGNHFLLVALCSFVLYQGAHSALHCTQSVPVSDDPMNFTVNGQNTTLQEVPPCPGNLPLFVTCAACYTDAHLLQVTCRRVIPMDIMVRHGNGDSTFIKMTSKDCNSFVKKSHRHRQKRSQLSSSVGPRVSETSVEEENKESVTPMTNNDEMCNMSVTVTDCPIVITQKKDVYTFHHVLLCPERVGILKNCSACFKDQSSLEISCTKNGDEDYGSLWVEHGRGQGASSLVEMNAEVCHKILKETDVGKTQGDQSDGGTSAEIKEYHNIEKKIKADKKGERSAGGTSAENSAGTCEDDSQRG
ncbi:uncharacterized protein [Dendropsophus ebraccatus]|uniref:uncharacterized protein isoform X2 n=1 Tax=Dendropsophus ebraccatus TaxID=150705 RepID=UPI003831808B